MEGIQKKIKNASSYQLLLLAIMVVGFTVAVYSIVTNANAQLNSTDWKAYFDTPISQLKFKDLAALLFVHAVLTGIYSRD